MTSKLLILLFYVIGLGFIMGRIYWFVEHLIVAALLWPFLRKAESLEPGSGKFKLFFGFACFLTFSFSACWASLCYFIAQYGIEYAQAVGWERWVFLICGLCVALGIPVDRERRAQELIAYPTISTIFLLMVFFKVPPKLLSH